MILRRRIPHVVALGLVFAACSGCSFPQEAASQTAPAQATIFAPGRISTGDYELNATFTPDGRTLFFTKSTPDARYRLMTILSATELNGRWQEPAVASFSGQYSEVDPFMSPDGSRLFFISQRPVDGTAPRNDFDIWFVDRTDGGWSPPHHLDAPINTDGQEYFPAVTADGTLYFSASREDSKGRFDLYRSRLVDGHYTQPENLGDAVNSESSEIDVFVAPDERYIIFVSYRPGGHGSGDLYVSYNRDGAWTPAQNLGEAVNSPALEYCPSVSPDGAFLYFTSERGFADEPLEKPLTYEALVSSIRGPGNGMGDIYRIPLQAAGLER